MPRPAPVPQQITTPMQNPIPMHIHQIPMGIQGRQPPPPYMIPAYPQIPMVRMAPGVYPGGKQKRNQMAKQPILPPVMMQPVPPPPQEQGLIAQQLNALPDNRLDLFLTLFEVHWMGKREERIGYFTSKVLPQLLSANSKHTQNIFTIINSLSDEKKYQYLANPKIPDVFQVAPETKTIYVLSALHPARYDFLNNIRDRRPDSYVIGHFLPWPANATFTETLLIDGVPSDPVQFGESENYYCVGTPDWRSQKQSINLVVNRNDVLTWFVMNVVIEKADLANQICETRGKRLEPGQRALVTTAKCDGCRAFDLQDFISETVKTGVAVCPRCRKRVLLSELFLESRESERPRPMPPPAAPPLIVPNLPIAVPGGHMMAPMPEDPARMKPARQMRETKAKPKRTASMANAGQIPGTGLLPVGHLDSQRDLVFQGGIPGVAQPMRNASNPPVMPVELEVLPGKRRKRNVTGVSDVADNGAPKENSRGGRKREPPQKAEEERAPVVPPARGPIQLQRHFHYEPIPVPDERLDEHMARWRSTAIHVKSRVSKACARIGERIFEGKLELEDAFDCEDNWNEPVTANDYIDLVDSLGE